MPRVGLRVRVQCAFRRRVRSVRQGLVVFVWVLFQFGRVLFAVVFAKPFFKGRAQAVVYVRSVAEYIGAKEPLQEQAGYGVVLAFPQCVFFRVHSPAVLLNVLACPVQQGRSTSAGGKHWRVGFVFCIAKLPPLAGFAKFRFSVVLCVWFQVNHNIYSNILPAVRQVF